VTGSIRINDEVEQCPTCGQSVRIASTAEGTSYYVGVAEINADMNAIRAGEHIADQALLASQSAVITNVRLYAEALTRSQIHGARTAGADLLQLIDG
jgi:hypothetical protein